MPLQTAAEEIGGQVHGQSSRRRIVAFAFVAEKGMGGVEFEPGGFLAYFSINLNIVRYLTCDEFGTKEGGEKYRVLPPKYRACRADAVQPPVDPGTLGRPGEPSTPAPPRPANFVE
jgi:hypothetical protein